MSTDELPERLLTAGDDPMERRLVAAVAQERPSAELRQRMAHAIGIPGAMAVGTGSGATPSPAAVENASTEGMTGTGTAATSSAALPVLTVGALVLTLVAGIVGPRVWSGGRGQEPVWRAPSVVAAPSSEMADTAFVAANEAPRDQPPQKRRPRSRALVNDLRDQIAMIDGARAALRASTGERALEILGKYEDKYPAGALRPEAAALKVETLARLGRRGEARALAHWFRTKYGDSPQADRVLRVAGAGP